MFWIADNGSAHRGEVSQERLTQWHGNTIQVHTPVHASWLNQIETYFSVVQRKVRTPNEFPDLETRQQTLWDFQAHYQTIARPFAWQFPRTDLDELLVKLARHQQPPHTAVASAAA